MLDEKHVRSRILTGCICARALGRQIVDRALPLYYILTDLGQQDEPFSDHSLNSILQ
jgi:hypothetical protein